MDELIRIQSINPDALQLDGFEECIVGIVEGYAAIGVLLYSESKIMKQLMDQGMTREDALEYFEYNILDAYFGEHMPMFLEDIV
jgi:hypothetical protein